MELPLEEEVVTATTTIGATHVVKGKRTKRLRVQSPTHFPLATDSSSGECGGGGEFFQDSTEEEEDMANCLILLARGGHQNYGDRNYHKSSNNNNVNHNASNGKFNSRRFMETVNSTGTGKVGYYVYECKTCNRTFPSFQALGGHRTSHKKPKSTFNNTKTNNVHNFDRKQRNNSFMSLYSSDEEFDANYKNISSLTLQISDSHNNNNNNNNANNNQFIKAKVHECAVCGAEFTSGQALGGHMRRHRSPLDTTTSLSLTTPPVSRSVVDQERNVERNYSISLERNASVSLDLDLNLPAPSEDDKVMENQQKLQAQPQSHSQQQDRTQNVVFSGPILVDCHY